MSALVAATAWAIPSLCGGGALTAWVEHAAVAACRAGRCWRPQPHFGRVAFSHAAASVPSEAGAVRSHRPPRTRRAGLLARGGDDDYRLNVGHAMDVLRSDVGHFFNSKPDYSIFAEDVVLEDQRVPSFRLHGIEAYRRTMDAIRWSIVNACGHQLWEITSASPAVNGVFYMRWRLRLWPRSPLAPARALLWPSLSWDHPLLRSGGLGEPIVVEGYSRYEFDAWIGKIVRHSIDITNPPTPLADVLCPMVQMPTLSLTPSVSRLGAPASVA